MFIRRINRINNKILLFFNNTVTSCSFFTRMPVDILLFSKCAFWLKTHKGRYCSFPCKTDVNEIPWPSHKTQWLEILTTGRPVTQQNESLSKHSGGMDLKLSGVILCPKQWQNTLNFSIQKQVAIFFFHKVFRRHLLYSPKL